MGERRVSERRFWYDMPVQALAGTIGGVLTLSLASWWTWWTGNGPAIWHALRNAATYVWRVVWAAVSYSISVPVSLLIVLFIVGLLLTRDSWRASPEPAREGAEAGAAAPPQNAAPEFRPDPLQESVLRILAELDGEAAHPTRDVADRIDATRLEVNQAVGRLEARGLIRRWDGGYGGNPGIDLTDRGRDLVIEAGFTQGRRRRR
jgi:hypothetical protein